jgi:hypothetical protein
VFVVPRGPQADQNAPWNEQANEDMDKQRHDCVRIIPLEEHLFVEPSAIGNDPEEDGPHDLHQSEYGREAKQPDKKPFLDRAWLKVGRLVWVHKLWVGNCSWEY